MNILTLGLLSIGLYIFGTAHQALVYYRKAPAKQFFSILIGATAAFSQLAITIEKITANEQLNLSFFNSASLTACLVVLCIILWSMRKPLQASLLAIYPISAFTVIALITFDNSTLSYTPIDSGIFIHIVLSILAYSVFSIATIQAVLVYLQNRNLKKRNHTHTVLMRNLPPLMTMENLLFEMLWCGTFILVAAIFAGILFIDDIFAQHLAHKSFFSIVALGVFSTLLIGRVKYGWRGITASKFTLWGSGLLMLAFFGSKFVLEWLIQDS